MDYAQGSFIEKWPQWIRWILCLPAALVGSFLGSVLYGLLQSFLTYGYSETFVQLIQSGLLGGLTVYFGAAMAPKYQFGVAMFLLVFVVLFAGFTFVTNFVTYTTTPFLTALHSLVMIGAAVAIVYQFYLNDSK